MGVQIVKLLDPLNPTIITGGLVPRGVYDNTVDYSVGDMVSYNGSSYVMFSDASAGTLPTDTTYWGLLASKGDSGPAGATGATGPAGADGADGLVQSVVAGNNTTVDSTDPANPIVNATNAVASVNGQTGVVILTKADIGLGNVTNDAQLKITSNLSDIASASSARTNLGLGTIATVAAPSGTVVGTSDSQTLINKRITKRVQTLTDAATVTPDCDSYDGGKLTSVSQATTIANPTGTPTSFQQYILRIKSTISQTLNWGTQYRGSTDVPLPTTTTGSSKTGYFGFQWNSDDSTWDLIALNRGF